MFGFDPRLHPEIMARVGILLEDDELFDFLRPLEFLDYCAALYGLDAGAARARAVDLLETLEVPTSGRLCHQLSTGNRRQLALAAALLHEPELLDPAGVESKFGVRPDQIIDYLALMGDKSDNIPGVPGVGAKTAAKWLDEYGSMQGIVEHAADIKGKIGEKLRDNLELLELSHRLATIRTDVPLALKFSQLERKAEDKQELHRLFTELEFRTWLRELEADGVSPPPAAQSETASGLESRPEPDAPQLRRRFP